MRRQSAQRGHDFMKWQPHSSAVEFERKRQWHERIHRLQLLLNITVVLALLVLMSAVVRHG